MKRVKLFIKNLSKYTSLLALVALFVVSCDSDNSVSEDNTETITDIAAENENFSILSNALSTTGLDAALDGEGPFTVFAPTDAAFEALPAGTLENLNADQLAEVLQFHVVGGNILSGELNSTQDVESLLGELLLVERDLTSGSITVNGSSSVSTGDLIADNGVIHVIDEVLLPQGYRAPNIIDQAEELGTFTTLVSAVESAGLQTTLQYKGDFTVFAPTDDAFAALPAGLLESLTVEQIAQILQYHVLGAEVFAQDLSTQQAPATLTDEPVYVTKSGEGAVTVNGSSNVVTADVDVSNGVIHAIDQVILPNAFLDIPGIASKNYDLTTLVDLLAQNDLVTTLQGDGPFTVFAPTNAAFDEVSATLSTLTAQQQQEVLLYHAVAVEALAGDLSDGQTITTVQGEDITVNIDGEGNVTLNGNVNVTTVDLEGINGVIHIIDGVLLPPSYQ